MMRYQTTQEMYKVISSKLRYLTRINLIGVGHKNLLSLPKKKQENTE